MTEYIESPVQGGRSREYQLSKGYALGTYTTYNSTEGRLNEIWVASVYLGDERSDYLIERILTAPEFESKVSRNVQKGLTFFMVNERDIESVISTLNCWIADLGDN